MKLTGEIQLLLFGIVPLLIPTLSLFLSRAITLKIAIAVCVSSIAYLTYTQFTAEGWTALLYTGGALAPRWAWPALEFPSAMNLPPTGPLLLIKTFFLALILGSRRQNRSWWWTCLDGALCLLVSAADLATYLSLWTVCAGLSLFWIARQMDGLSDENSETLLRFTGVLSIGFGALIFSLVVLASAQGAFGKAFGSGFGAFTGNTLTALMALWISCLLLSAGMVFQASQTVSVLVKRHSLAIFLVSFAVPGSLLLMRFIPSGAHIPYLAEMLVTGVVVGGICSFRSKTMEGMLAGTFISSQSALLLSLSLGAPARNETLMAHFGPFAILFALLAPLPPFLLPQKKYWMGCLRGLLRKTLAGTSLLFLALQMGTLPFGYLDFPFQKQLQYSTPIALFFCLGILAAVSGTLSVLGGFWFSDSSARWPTREYTELARRYFRV